MTAVKDRVCFVAPRTEKAYCGRRPAASVADWAKTTCEDCHAARRADEAAA